VASASGRVVSVMGIGILIVVVSAVFVVWSLGRSDLLLSQNGPATRTSPLDEAERILAARYARGAITPDEYRRMLSILRT